MKTAVIVKVAYNITDIVIFDNTDRALEFASNAFEDGFFVDIIHNVYVVTIK